MATVAILGTCDTKLPEILFLRDRIKHVHNLSVILLDVGRKPVQHDAIDISQQKLLDDYGDGKHVQDLPRGDVIKTMSSCATKCVKALREKGSIHGIIAAGGSGGTSLSAAVMREALPLGFPKLIVSTVASGDTGPIVEETDITLMYSIVDIAGLNDLLRSILRNAAAAIAGMSQVYIDAQQRQPSKDRESKAKKIRIGITMFGVTTPCVDAVRDFFETRYGDQTEVYVFHATGHGGRAMERMVSSGALDAVLDLTTTEICDLLTDGNMSAGPNRLEAAARAGIPNLVSVGATDMSNYGPRGTVPERYKDRLLFEHNPMVTLMRTSKEECSQIGTFIADKLKENVKRKDLVEVWLPKGGVSILSVPGAPFADRDADNALFESIRKGLDNTGIAVIEDERPINDKGFAGAVAEKLAGLVGLK